MQETRVWSLGREDPVEEKMATHYSLLAWEIPQTEEPGRLQSMGLQRGGHKGVSPHTHTLMSSWPRNYHDGWWLGWFRDGMDECLRLATSTRHCNLTGETSCVDRRQLVSKAGRLQAMLKGVELLEESQRRRRGWAASNEVRLQTEGDTEHLRHKSVYVVTICYLWDASRCNEPHVKSFKFSGAKIDSSGRVMFWNSSVQSLSCVQLFSASWTAARQASLSFTISQSLLKLMSVELVMSSNHLILCQPLSAFNLSQHQGLFQWANSSHQVAIVLELQRQSFQWIFLEGLISFRIDWFDLAFQGNLKSLLQPHSSEIV